MLEHDGLRRARTEDTDRVARLYLASQGTNSTAASRAALDPQVVQRWLRKAVLHDEVWVLEEQYGRLIGMLALSGTELEALDVDPSMRRRGLGRLLVEHAKSRRPGGLRARLAHGRHDARAFLTGHGFHADGRLGGAWEELSWRLSGRTASAAPFRVVSTASGPRV